MAFCGNCGATMEATERFCSKCGKDNGIKTAASPIAAMPPAQPLAPAPGPYAAPPGVFPAPVGVLPQAPAHKSGTMGSIIALLVLAAGGYYWYSHRTIAAQPQTPPAVQTPTTGGGGGNNPPAGQQPPSGPSNADLVKQQTFTNGQPYTSNGYLEIPSGKWTNNSQVTLASAVLECDQNASNGTLLAQMRATLTPDNGPVAPGGTITFNTIQMGSVATYVSKVDCNIIHVKQVSQQ